MSIPVITGFDVKKAIPIDPKESVATSAARLAITYPYKGLVVRQDDTGELYRYITTTPVDGSIPSNVSGDWELVLTVFTATGAPATGKGVVGDIYMDETSFIVYKKTGVATWTSLFTISGSKIYTGTGVPSGGLGVNGDMYVRDTGLVYTKAAGVWTYQFDISGIDGTSDKYATTSATSLDVDTVAAPLAITVGTGLAYTVGQDVIMASRGTPSKTIAGTVVAYNTGTGAMTLDPITPTGTGTAEVDWDVNLSGAPGVQGKAFIHTEADINFNEAKVSSVEAGSWTPQNPWSASVANDSRTSLGAPAALAGSKTGYSIAYDGTTWYNNGRWLGPTGNTGPAGPQGIQGIQGLTGPAGLIPFSDLGAPLTVENLSKGWYFIDTLDNLSGSLHVIFGGNNALGTVVTVCRTTSSIDGATPPNSSFTASIGKNSAASLNYKGRYVTSIPLNVRNITFIAYHPPGDPSITYWKCIGEEADYNLDVRANFAPVFSGVNNLLFAAGAISNITYSTTIVPAGVVTVPKLEFTFGCFRQGADVNISATILYSDDGVTYFSLKQSNYYLQRDLPLYMTITAVDNNATAGLSRYYRLYVAGSTTFRPSISADQSIYSVLRY